MPTNPQKKRFEPQRRKDAKKKQNITRFSLLTRRVSRRLFPIALISLRLSAFAVLN